MEIKKVKKRKDGLKTVTIPKHCDIHDGDYVKIIKIEDTSE